MVKTPQCYMRKIMLTIHTGGFNEPNFVLVRKINHLDIRKIKHCRNDDRRYPLERPQENIISSCSNK